MTKINILDKSVYNRISAGEVVENPASIVKELVENSIDAGANRITIDIENGGIKSITVTDNGCGMEKDDISLAVLAHATSKIKTGADLDTISTLGFRGEALASIAAVSELTIKSKYYDESVANFIEVKGGEVTSAGECAMAGGTQISVRSLFFNTPARFKFLKTPKSEENAITALVAELIFANPYIAFHYTADGAVIYHTNGDCLESCIYAVYGDTIGNNMIRIDFEDKGYMLHGYIARPASEAIKNNRTKQTFIVNGRVINEPTISAVVQNAYGELLMKRTFPILILDIVIPFDMVDVNVHPNKREVRFADAKKINGIIYHTIKDAIEKETASTQRSLFEEFHTVIPQTTTKPILPYKSETSEVLTQSFNSVEEEEDGYLPGEKIVYPSISVNFKPKTVVQTPPPRTETQLTFSDVSTETVTQDKAEKINYRVIGQLFNTYLLIELDETVIFIDQHAAHERILFDDLVEKSKRNIPVQMLLLPYVFPVDDVDKEFFINYKDNFEKLGFTITVSYGEVVVKSVPASLTKMNIGDFLREVAAYKTELNELTDSSIIKDRLAKYACKNAIKGGAALSNDQIELVLKYFFKNGVPLQCPHGRPTMIKFTKNEIEKFFGRKV